MSRCNFWGSHHVAVVVHHVNPLGELTVSHQGHVTDVSGRCRFRKRQFVQRKYEDKRTLSCRAPRWPADPLKPTYSWEGDKSLYDGSAGRAQLVGILNQNVQPHLSNTQVDVWKCTRNVSLKSRVRKKSCHDWGASAIRLVKLTHGYRNSAGDGSCVTLKKLRCRCGLKGEKSPASDLVPTVKKSGQRLSEGPVILEEPLNESTSHWEINRLFLPSWHCGWRSSRRRCDSGSTTEGTTETTKDWRNGSEEDAREKMVGSGRAWTQSRHEFTLPAI